MTTININGEKTYTATITNASALTYYFKDDVVHSARKVESMIGYFNSKVITAPDNFVSWKNLVYEGEKFLGTDIQFYVRATNTEGQIETALWYGPLLNTDNDISNFTGKYIQFMIVLIADGSNKTIDYSTHRLISPILRSIGLSYYARETAVKFFTKTFDTNFAPKHILVTYNGTVPTNAVLKFAVTGFDSVDTDDYQYIDPNTITELTSLSQLSTKIKLMIELTSDSGVPVTIDEFAFIFSGDDAARLNKE